MIVKYLVCIIFALLPCAVTNTVNYSIAALAELLLIAVLTNTISLKKPVLANIFNDIFVILFDTQMAVLFFSTSYVETVMLSNMESLEDISGNAAEYITAVVIILLTGVMPVRTVGQRLLNRAWKVLTSILVAVFAVFLTVLTIGSNYSPFANYGALLRQEYKIYEMRKYVSQETTADIDKETEEGIDSLFYSATVSDYRTKDTALPEQPNIILIFTEGLSQNIVDDERNIMPNVAVLEEKSINFTGYYNHTFATYRGISGQLYSGYQMDNLDENCLVSLQSILSGEGYSTVFVNSEPANKDFTSYLNALGFDEVVGSIEDTTSGMADSYSDGEVYELLWETVVSLSEKDEPFFTAVYTFGTHATYVTEEEVFGDGSNNELNKFYNADYQLGLFLEKFEESSLSENTVIIFTADHATYQDVEFAGAFPNYERSSSQTDEIPFCIYYKGVVPETIEVNGRNSLELVPTILDFLDISAPNYFLGDSLFSEDEGNSLYDTFFYSETSPLSTEGGIITNLDQEETEWFEDILRQYFVEKLSNPSSDEVESINSSSDTRTETSVSDDGQTLEITYTPETDETYSQYWFAVWSAENAQDDLVWYMAETTEDGAWVYEVPLAVHTMEGEIEIDVYGGETEPVDKLDLIAILLPSE